MRLPESSLPPPLLAVISGPSGVGKDAVLGSCGGWGGRGILR